MNDTLYDGKPMMTLVTQTHQLKSRLNE